MEYMLLHIMCIKSVYYIISSVYLLQTVQIMCYEVILTPYYTLLRNDSVSAHPLRYSPSVQGDNEGVHIPLTP